MEFKEEVTHRTLVQTGDITHPTANVTYRRAERVHRVEWAYYPFVLPAPPEPPEYEEYPTHDLGVARAKQVIEALIDNEPVPDPTGLLIEHAERRVDGSAALRPYRDLLVGRDWGEGMGHYLWVLGADEDVLLLWAEDRSSEEVRSSG